MSRQVYRLVHQEARNRALSALVDAPEGVIVEIRQATRNLEQNALLWKLLSDVSSQVDWYGQKLDAEDWKCVFTAALRKERVVPGINGGFVVLGQSTRNMTKGEFSELIELIHAFAAEKGVTL